MKIQDVQTYQDELFARIKQDNINNNRYNQSVQAKPKQQLIILNSGNKKNSHKPFQQPFHKNEVNLVQNLKQKTNNDNEIINSVSLNLHHLPEEVKENIVDTDDERNIHLNICEINKEFEPFYK